MSRVTWKPTSVSRKMRRHLIGIVTTILKVRREPYTRVRLWCERCRARFGFINNRLLNTRYLRLRLRGYTANGLLYAKSSDTIMRLMRFGAIQQNLTYKTIYEKETWRELRYFNRLGKKFYRVSKYMTNQKFGGFLRTRFVGGFRKRVDKKKIEKLKKDMVKLKKRELHTRKENTRLMKKAIQETRAKNRKKAGARPKKKATR